MASKELKLLILFIFTNTLLLESDIIYKRSNILDMEIKLGEVDRARSILGYASQFCDPRIDPEFWKTWHDFEVKFGNEDTFKEMLR
jgi:hypothetical protein